MSSMERQITSMSMIYLTICSGTDERKPFVQVQMKENIKLHITGLCESNSPASSEFHVQRPVMQKIFHLMTSSWFFSSIAADCSGAGDGELAIDISHGGRTVPAHIQEDPVRRGVYRISFTPDGSGIYTIRVYFAGMEVSGKCQHYVIVLHYDQGLIPLKIYELVTQILNEKKSYCSYLNNDDPNEVTILHVTKLSWHVQICDLIGLLES